MSGNDNFVRYAIPKKDQNYITNREVHAWKIVSKLYDKTKIEENSRLTNGCNIINFYNKFVGLLDEAYKSFLLGLNYSAVSLCCMASERLCYDLIEYSQIYLDTEILNSEQKKFLFNMPFNKLVKFLFSTKLITEQMKKDIMKIDNVRNRYLHPTIEKDSTAQDAKMLLDLLCKIIDSLIIYKK
jgi:endo-1,4-beta-mannosidase